MGMRMMREPLVRLVRPRRCEKHTEYSQVSVLTEHIDRRILPASD